jgi:hypothetical protein
MAAGDLSYILAFVYASDDDVPIAAGDPIYYPGLPMGKVEFTHPTATFHGKTYWTANSAQPAGLVPKKIDILDGEIGMGVFPVDAVPFYLALGGVPALSSNIFTLKGSTSGSVPSTIWHRENNEIVNEQAKEYKACKCRELALSLMDGDVFTRLNFLAETEYNMTSHSVVRQTGVPVLRGSVDTGTYKSPSSMLAYGKYPYPVHSNTNGHSITWGGKTLPYLQDVKFSIKNHQIAKQYSAENWSVIQNKGKREFSELNMTFAVKSAATNDLDDMEALVQAKASSNLVWKVCRRHASDYLQLTFENAYLKSWTFSPTPMGEQYESVAIASWIGITDVEVKDASALANGNADPAAAADYEAVT